MLEQPAPVFDHVAVADSAQSAQIGPSSKSSAPITSLPRWARVSILPYVWKYDALLLPKPLREQLIDELGEILASLQIQQAPHGLLMRHLPQQYRARL